MTYIFIDELSPPPPEKLYNMTCQKKLQAQNEPYPRTCPECQLGPCKYRDEMIYDESGWPVGFASPKEDKDEQLISTALELWANYIETGEVTLSRNDAIASGKEKTVKYLDSNQVQKVLRLRGLAAKYRGK